MKLGLYSLVVLCLSGCASTKNNNFNSTLWMQTSSEYKANSFQSYNIALANIELALADSSWSAAIEQKNNYSLLPPAVVMDIDETVLDNSKYQAKLVLKGGQYDDVTWDAWVGLRSATDVPGAVDFINEMRDRNVEVIFITNRECKKREENTSLCPQEIDTIDNLERVGISEVKPNNILLKNEVSGWASEKKNRRIFVAEKYRILMLFGDDLGDFLPDVKNNITPSERDLMVNQHRSKWGVKWYVLSNPTYGSWLRVLSEPRLQHLITY